MHICLFLLVSLITKPSDRISGTCRWCCCWRQSSTKLKTGDSMRYLKVRRLICDLWFLFLLRSVITSVASIHISETRYPGPCSFVPWIHLSQQFSCNRGSCNHQCQVQLKLLKTPALWILPRHIVKRCLPHSTTCSSSPFFLSVPWQCQISNAFTYYVQAGLTLCTLSILYLKTTPRLRKLVISSGPASVGLLTRNSSMVWRMCKLFFWTMYEFTERYLQ